MIHHISADHLSVERVEEILTKNYKLALSDDARSSKSAATTAATRRSAIS